MVSGGSRTRAASAELRTHSGIRPEEESCSRRSSCRPTRRPRIGAQRRPQVTPAAFLLSLRWSELFRFESNVWRREANPRGLGRSRGRNAAFEPRRKNVLEDPPADRRDDRGCHTRFGPERPIQPPRAVESAGWHSFLPRNIGRPCSTNSSRGRRNRGSIRPTGGQPSSAARLMPHPRLASPLVMAVGQTVIPAASVQCGPRGEQLLNEYGVSIPAASAWAVRHHGLCGAVTAGSCRVPQDRKKVAGRAG